VRIGIDMDSDGILDADDARPNVPDAAPVNLAVSGTTTAASVWDGNHTAAKAIDGNTMGYFDQNSMLHTAGGTNDWFQDDLGTNAQINLIQLFNRWDCCANRLANVSVFVSQYPFVSPDVNQTGAQLGVKEYFLSGLQATLAQIPVQAAGRYVRVQLNAAGVPLQLAEVRIIGYPIASIVNPGTQTTSVGETVDLPLQATNMPANGFSSLVATNRPAGLGINALSGVISGTIQSAAASSYTGTVTASGAGRRAIRYFPVEHQQRRGGYQSHVSAGRGGKLRGGKRRLYQLHGRHQQHVRAKSKRLGQPIRVQEASRWLSTWRLASLRTEVSRTDPVCVWAFVCAEFIEDHQEHYIAQQSRGGGACDDAYACQQSVRLLSRRLISARQTIWPPSPTMASR
jgi:hypothetical protein